MKKTLQILGLLTFGSLGLYAQDPGTTVGSTGTVTGTYGGQPVTLTSVRAADGKIWLQQNLGATQVATSATDVASYGDLFQWGRWTDGHQLRTSTVQQVTTLTNNTPAGIAPGNANFLRNNVQPLWWGGSSTTTPAGAPLITDTWSAGAPSATNGTDPCSELGVGWRLPTKTEWEAVLLAENITNLATSFSSNLKLPSSGHRNGANGSVQQPGFASLFWTSTNFSATAPYGVFNGAMVNYWTRGYAGSCRCVKDVVPCSGTPDAGNASSSATDICPGSSFDLSLSGVSTAVGVQYQWQSRPVGTGLFTDMSGANTITYTVNNQTIGMEYRCVVTCTNSSQTVNSDTVAVNIETIDVDLGNDTTFCSGNMLTLDADDAGTGAVYLWSNNATTQTTDVNTSGQYWVAVEAANGCVGSDTINVTVVDAPSADGINIVEGTDNEFSFIADNVIGATSYVWDFGDNSATSTDANPSHTYQPGTYTVTLTISNDCGDLTLTGTVEVTPLSIKRTSAEQLGIRLYPNPTARDIFLEYAGTIKVNNIILTNTLGQQVYQKHAAVEKIDVGHLANGLYFMHIHTELGIAVLKVNIQR